MRTYRGQQWRSAPEHESRPSQKAVFDGLRPCLGGVQVNEFPARHQCAVARFAPFAGPDTKSLAASRKRPLRGLHEKSGCRRRGRRPPDFVLVRVGNRAGQGKQVRASKRGGVGAAARFCHFVAKRQRAAIPHFRHGIARRWMGRRTDCNGGRNWRANFIPCGASRIVGILPRHGGTISIAACARLPYTHSL